MHAFRRAVFNLRRQLALATLAVLVLGLASGLVALVARSAGDLGDHALRVALVVGVLVVLTALCAIVGRPLPKRVVLELDLTEIPAEAAPSGPMALLSSGRDLSLRQVIETIDRAADDDRVKVLLAYIRFGAGGLGSIQELRDAVLRLRAAGKRAIAFSDTFGQLGGGNGSYYLASAFDEIVLQPSGEVGLVGLHRDVNFVKRALDKVGIEVTAEGRHEYKNAANQLTHTGFTDPHREALSRILDSQWDQIVAGVAAERELDPAAVRAAADRAPLFSHEALDAGLIDRVGFRDEAVDRAKELAGAGAELRWLARYRRLAKRSDRGRPTVAVITAVGPIHQTTVPFDPLSPGGPHIAADQLASTIRKAVDDKKVKAILLRVSSPGGSAVGSETMWREVVRAGRAGTPVVASMGDVAASGGYYLSMAAARIVAQPGTITGSIGVIAQKPVLARAKARLGIDVEALSTATNAGLLTLNRPFTDTEHERFAAFLDTVYDDFVGKVGEGRNLTKDEVHEVARGRVWTGEDALPRRLVDELGGFDAALRHVRELAGLEPGERVHLVDFPKRSKLDQLRPSPGRSSEDPKGASALLALVGPIARALGLSAPRGVLHADLDPEDWLIR